LKDAKVTVNTEAPPDKRSYKVNFDLYKKLAPNHQPQFQLKPTIANLYESLVEMGFNDSNYRKSGLMRLNVINQLKSNKMLDDKLYWNWK